jgi:cobalt-zinc-cadmium efflux system membrane fusion protein
MIRLLLLLAAGLACKRQGDDHADPHGPHRAGEPAGEHAAVKESNPGLLRVDPEMVRDLRITTTKVEGRAGGEGITLLGELQVDQDTYAEVGVPVSGRVMRLLASAGDRVTAGQVLAEIESVELGKARAAEVAAQARADLARQALERKRQLVSERIAAERELEEAQAEARAAEAEWRAARTTLQALGSAATPAPRSDRAGARFALRAPLGGTVLERNAARGQVVHPETSLYRIADLASVWLTVHAFERDALRIRPGARAQVTFPALPGRTFDAAVTWVGSQVDVASRTIPVRVTVPNPDGLLRPGMSAGAFILVGDPASKVLAVPAASLQRVERDWVVFLPAEQRHTFQVRKVGRGRDLGGEVEIVSNLASGEVVVVDGAFLLKAEAEKARGMGEHHEH